MSQAFYTGLSGLRSNQYAIDVVSDNLANISTVGFRGSEYEFSSLFGDMINTDANSGSGNSSVSLGTQMQSTSLKTSVGSLAPTERSTDLAILGNGWFGVQGEGDPVYTRDGAFTFDAENDMVTADGYYVLGTIGNNISKDNILTKTIDTMALGPVSAQEKLRFPKSLSYPPEPTTRVAFSGNLGGVDVQQTIGAGAVDAQNNKNDIKLVATMSVPQVFPGSQWDILATAASSDGSTIYDTQTGKLSFDEYGSLVGSTLTSLNNNGVVVEIDLGDNFTGMVDLRNTPAYQDSQANGTVGGDLRGYSINKNAEVIATFTNGMQSSVGKIAVYHFQNDQGLERVNSSKFQATQNSGNPIFFQNAAGENIIGTDISNFKLEGSNIDMTYGLTELIILQRSYDANSKSVTTADQMMQKALNMDA